MIIIILWKYRGCMGLHRVIWIKIIHLWHYYIEKGGLYSKRVQETMEENKLTEYKYMSILNGEKRFRHLYVQER